MRGQDDTLVQSNSVISDGQPVVSHRGLRRIMKIGDGSTHYRDLDDILEKDTSHNSIVRGKNLGDVYSISDLHDMVSSSDFSDIYTGDYIQMLVPEINQTHPYTFRVGGLNLFLGSGIPNIAAGTFVPFNSPHIVFVPDQVFPMSVWNPKPDMEEGYFSSYILNSVMPHYNTILSEYFEHHILEHQVTAVNMVTSTIPSMSDPEGLGASVNAISASVYLDLMSEIQVVGHSVWASSGYDVDCNSGQFPLFRLQPSYRWSYTPDDPQTLRSYWLKTICRSATSNRPTDSRVSAVSDADTISNYPPKIGQYVRPYFLFG